MAAVTAPFANFPPVALDTVPPTIDASAPWAKRLPSKPLAMYGDEAAVTPEDRKPCPN